MFYSFVLNVVGFVVANCVRNHFPSDLQFSKMSLLHHLIRKALPVFQRHFHQILPWGEALHVYAFQSLALRAHKAPLQVVELDLFGLHVGRVLQAKLVVSGVGVVHIGAEEGFGFMNAINVIIVDEIEEEIIGCPNPVDPSANCKSFICHTHTAIGMEIPR